MDSVFSYSLMAFAGALCSTVSFKLYEWYVENQQSKRRKKQDEIVGTGNSNTAEDDEETAARDERKPPEQWNTVLFFPDPYYPVGIKYGSTNHEFPEIPESPTYKFLQYFKAAELSIHLCISLASFSPLEKILRDKLRDGRIVCIITDHDMIEAHNNFLVKQIRRCAPGRVQIRKRNFGYLMHNKFAIIDDEAVLTGSMNWTQQGFRGNFEDILITTNQKIVQAYVKEFTKIWLESEDY